MDEQELRKINAIFNDTWRFLKQHSDVKDTDAYWTEVLDEANRIADKHERHPFGDELIVLCLDYLDAVAKGDEMKPGWRKKKNDKAEI